MERRFGQRSDDLYFRRVLPALSRMPPRVGYRCVRGLSRIVRARNPENARAALMALESCRSQGIELANAPSTIVGELFCQLAWEDFDFFHRRHWNSENWDSWFTIRGADVLDRSDGAILLTGHMGSVSCGLMALGVRGYPITHVSRDYHREKGIPSAFHRYALAKSRAIEEATRLPLVFADARDRTRASRSVLEISRRLRAGLLVSMALDLPADRLAETLECRFLGGTAHLGSSIVRLAQALSQPVIPYWIVRDPGRPWQHIVEVEPPFRVEDPATAQQQCASILERAILRRPEQWFAWDSLQRLRMTPA